MFTNLSICQRILQVVHKMLNAYNDAQDYESSVKLVEDLQEVPTLSFMQHSAIQYLYAFALNRYTVNI